MSQKEATSLDQNWKEVVYRRLQERNQRESKPLQHIYKQHQQLLNNYVHLEGQRDSAKHALKLLEFETVDMMSRKDSDAKAVVSYFKQQVSNIQRDLAPNNNGNNNEPLSKTIYDQKKIISNQVEEMRIAKSELQNALVELASLRTAHEPCQQTLSQQENQLAEMKSMMHSMEEFISQLKKDNHNLTERLISEKEQSAKHMNEINTLLEELNMHKSNTNEEPS